MPNLPIVLKWKRDSKGYRLDNRGKYGVWIVREGGAMIDTDPLTEESTLFVRFGNINQQQEALKFIKRYGFLRDADPRATTHFHLSKAGELALDESAPSISGEQVENILEWARLFREVMLQAPRGWNSVQPQVVEALYYQLLWDDLGTVQTIDHVRPVVIPNCLLYFMWFTLVESIFDGMKFETCRNCDKLFKKGPGMGRRADAQFCSNKCKVRRLSLDRSIKKRGA
jgi:hypothetical protein